MENESIKVNPLSIKEIRSTTKKPICVIQTHLEDLTNHYAHSSFTQTPNQQRTTETKEQLQNENKPEVDEYAIS